MSRMPLTPVLSPELRIMPASETASLPHRRTELARLADDVVRHRLRPLAELSAHLVREEAEVVDSLERLDILVERQGPSREETHARQALLGYLEVLISIIGHLALQGWWSVWRTHRSRRPEDGMVPCSRKFGSRLTAPTRAQTGRRRFPTAKAPRFQKMG